MSFALVTAAAMVIPGAGPLGAEDRSCPGFEAGRAHPIDADRFYVHRAISIVQAAVAEDPDVLGALVAPDARFELWRGDYISSARTVGSAGAIDLARDMRPVRFVSQSVLPGPVVVDLTECTWDVTVLFLTGQPSHGVSLKFSFRNGLLASAIGNEVALLKGSVR